MATKKKKPKYIRQVTPGELLETATAHLQHGRIDEALHELRQAETQLRPRITLAGRKITTPPHLLAAQMAYPALLARALMARARFTTDPQRREQDLAEAVQLVPVEHRYRIALGAARLLAGDAPAANSEFTQTVGQKPGDDLATRALVAGWLATGHTREAGDVIAQWPAERRHPGWQRLAAVRALLVSNAANSHPLLSGLSQLLAGDHERAQETLGALPILSGNPSRAEAAQLATQFFYSGVLHFTAARHRAALGDWREAERLCAAHQFVLPWRDRLVAYYHKTAEALVTEHLALALECWGAVLRIAPNDTVAAANLTAAKQAHAHEAWRAGQLEQAVTLWQEGLIAQPQDETLLKHLALAYEKLERRPQAIGHWRELAKFWRKQSKQRANEADFKERLLKLEQHIVKLMLESGESPEQIVQELEAALQVDPDNRQLRLQIVEQLTELGRAPQALKHLEALEKQEGVKAELLVRKALALDMINRQSDAHKALERAVALEPDNSVVRQSLLLFLGKEAERATERNDHKRAIELCEKQLAMEPNYDPALVQLGALYFEKKRAPEARALLERATAITPQTAERLVLIGGVYVRHKQKKEAEAVFQQALKLDASDTCYFLIGMAYWAAQEDKLALKHFEQAAKTASVEMLLQIAMNMVEAGRTRDADRYFNLAMKRDPLHPLPHVTKAISLLGIGDPLSMLMGPNPKNLAAAQKEMAEAERLMEGRPEFASLLAEMRAAQQSLNQGPPGLSGLLGGRLPPFFFGDEDDDEFDPFGFDPIFGKSKRKKKKR